MKSEKPWNTQCQLPINPLWTEKQTLECRLSRLAFHTHTHAHTHRIYDEDAEECLRQCSSLLDEPQLDTGVRTGDVYGLMIEHYGQTANYEKVRIHVYITCAFELVDTFSMLLDGPVPFGQLSSSKSQFPLHLVNCPLRQFPLGQH